MPGNRTPRPPRRYPRGVADLAYAPPSDDGTPDLTRLPIPVHCAACAMSRADGQRAPWTLAVARWAEGPLVVPAADARPALFELTYAPTRKVRPSYRMSDGSPLPADADIRWRSRRVLAGSPITGRHLWHCHWCRGSQEYDTEAVLDVVVASRARGLGECFLPLRAARGDNSREVH